MAALLTNTAPTIPSTWYFGLSSTNPGLAGSPTEPTIGTNAYARLSVSNASSKFTTAANTSYSTPYCTNKTILSFPQPTGTWGSSPLAYWFLADASSGGNVWAYGIIPAPVTTTSAATGQATPSFAVGAINIATP
jgi:hypothetical protein